MDSNWRDWRPINRNQYRLGATPTEDTDSSNNRDRQPEQDRRRIGRHREVYNWYSRSRPLNGVPQFRRVIQKNWNDLEGRELQERIKELDRRRFGGILGDGDGAIQMSDSGQPVTQPDHDRHNNEAPIHSDLEKKMKNHCRSNQEHTRNDKKVISKNSF